MDKWNSTTRVLVQLRKLSRKKIYPVDLNEKSETEWEAFLTWNDGMSYRFFPNHFERKKGEELIFKLNYSEIIDQYFRKEENVRKWANENLSQEKRSDAAYAKKAYYSEYNLVSKSGNIYKCEGKYSWPIYETMKNLGK